MPVKRNSIVSAQVILRPANGRPIDGRAVISAGNIAEFLPSPEVVSSAISVFGSEGFDVGPRIGISFSISGTVETFEKFFGVKIRLGADQALEFVNKNGTAGHELEGRDLPESIGGSVLIVAFALPPDFGPTKFDD